MVKETFCLTSCKPMRLYLRQNSGCREGGVNDGVNSSMTEVKSITRFAADAMNAQCWDCYFGRYVVCRLQFQDGDQQKLSMSCHPSSSPQMWLEGLHHIPEALSMVTNSLTCSTSSLTPCRRVEAVASALMESQSPSQHLHQQGGYTYGPQTTFSDPCASITFVMLHWMFW